MLFDSQDLITLFNNLFQTTEQTILVGGGTEPVYLPKNELSPHNQIIFTHDYFASALHEVAHWCVAGAERRKLVDYGYWYKPDGRSAEEQILFEQVEVKPQALEWIFSMATGKEFRVSADNLTINATSSLEFKKNIYLQVIHYFESGLPIRAAKFTQILLKFYDHASKFNLELFSLKNL